MPRIQCLLGPASDVYIGGTAYNFENDRHGRAVADVYDELHVRCLISIEHYRLLPDDMLLGDPASSTALSPVGGGEQVDDDDEDDGNITETTLLLGGGSFTPGIQLPDGTATGESQPAGEGEGTSGEADKTPGNPDTNANNADSNGQGGDNSGAGEPPVPPVTTPATPPAEPVKLEKPEGEAAPKSRGRPKKADAAPKPNDK